MSLSTTGQGCEQSWKRGEKKPSRLISQCNTPKNTIENSFIHSFRCFLSRSSPSILQSDGAVVVALGAVRIHCGMSFFLCFGLALRWSRPVQQSTLRAYFKNLRNCPIMVTSFLLFLFSDDHVGRRGASGEQMRRRGDFRLQLKSRNWYYQKRIIICRN